MINFVNYIEFILKIGKKEKKREKKREKNIMTAIDANICYSRRKKPKFQYNYSKY
jgi:hypothetical protein